MSKASETRIILPVKELDRPRRFALQQAQTFILKSLSVETRRNYERIIKEFFAFQGYKHPADIMPQEVLRWRDKLISANQRPATVVTKLAVIRSFFDYLAAHGQIALNPAGSKLVAVPKLPESQAGRALEAKEVRYLLAGPDQETVTGARDYALLLLMARTSLRVSEAVRVKYSALGRTRGRHTLTVKVKGGEERLIPLPNDVKQALEDYLRLDAANRVLSKSGGPEAYIFQSDIQKRVIGENRPLTTRHVWYLVKKWGEFAGLGKVTPHDLRRTAITRALDSGHSYRKVQAMSGHKDINSVIRYDRHRLNLEENSINELNYNEDS